MTRRVTIECDLCGKEHELVNFTNECRLTLMSGINVEFEKEICAECRGKLLAVLGGPIFRGARVDMTPPKRVRKLSWSG
jgi:hypothetical protein